MTKLSVKQQAIKDIKEDLVYGKSFLAFRRYLDPIMKALVKQQLQEQKKLEKNGKKKKN